MVGAGAAPGLENNVRELAGELVREEKVLARVATASSGVGVEARRGEARRGASASPLARSLPRPTDRPTDRVANMPM